jgi:hypothetical protein
MRHVIAFAFLLTLFNNFAFAQAPSRSQASQKVQPSTGPSQLQQTDMLGMNCAQILQMSSTDWIAHFNHAGGEKPAAASAKGFPIDVLPAPTAENTTRAVTSYGKCYDARTDRLKASLAKSGKGPLMGATGNFRDFDQALQKFTAKALAESEPPADAVKTAYAALYEKQFRYAFYQSYEQPAAKASLPAAAPPQPKTAPQPSSVPQPVPSPTAASGAPPAAKDVDPVTLAKNHFGKLLSDLPDDKMHDLHAAFGQILVLNSVGANMQLAIYRYAIFLLEPPVRAGDPSQPFAPPPF